MRFKGRVAIVTGGGRGIGEGIARRLATEGARVLIVDMRSDELARVGAQTWARECVTLEVDLTSEDGPGKVYEKAMSLSGKIDVLVNNAGIGISGSIEDFSDEEWNRAIAVNLTAPFRLCRRIVPHMAAAGYGRVVNISSMNASMGMRGDAAYSASKAGLEALTRSIAADYGPLGITANTIAPGTIETPLNTQILSTWGDDSALKQIVITNKPVRGNGSVEDIAAGVAYLASEEAKYVSAQCLAIDGGLTGTRFVPDPNTGPTARFVEQEK